MKKICYLNITDGKFTLWDNPQEDTQPMVFTQDELGIITVEPVRISLEKKVRLAAAFALSNLGHQVPDGIADYPYNDKSAATAVCNFGGHLMESDEHEEIFIGEAEMWYDTLGQQSVNSILKTFGPHSPWIERILVV